ncbi:ABC transporter permease [Rhizobium sp. BK602]|uniref:ABC transporter permease n=1 Tax=Rhizobium sp. BK602 TaxID=2586986 RepID=UPI001617C4AC|nr:ABC transporter permease [Rhizobium sp. BK602]MBB3609659.1 peptide/nickel transport system permease protein [Rhizobium sp. BK602]
MSNQPLAEEIQLDAQASKASARKSAGAYLLRLLVKRLALGLVLLWAVSLVIFAGTQILPGDVATAMLGQQATPEAVASIRKELGLEKPAPQRYVEWLGGALHGDFGRSYSNRQDIAKSIAPRLKNTLYLAAMAAVVAVPLSILLGILCVLYAGTWIDRTIGIVTLSAISLPEFFAGYLLIAYFSVSHFWLPSSATVSDAMPLGQRLITMLLPCLTLVLAVVGHMMRMTRAALLNVMASPYIETAFLKGLPGWRIVWKHALPNALSPIVNVVALNLAYLIVGVVVVEVIFVYPGMGQYLVDHVAKRDVPVVQAAGLIFAAVYILLNIVADMVSILANPRLRHPR